MNEGDTFQSHKKSINKIQSLIDDPLLSEFKYHFIIKKLPLLHLIYDKIAWNSLILNLYQGFNANFIGHNSIHIVQLLNIMPQSRYCDLIVGFRRDQQALKFYSQICVFEFQGLKYQIEVAEGFKTYLDELNERCRQQAAERQKIRAQENQQFLRNFQLQEKSKVSPTFIRQTSNPISVYQSKSQNSISDIGPQQGEIIDTPRKQSVGRKNSSSRQSSSVSSRSDRSKQQNNKANSKDNSSYQSSSDRFNRKKTSIKEKSYRQGSNSRSSSSRKSSRSSSSSPSSRGKGSQYRNSDRKQRSRDRRSYKRDSSSQYSQSSNYHKNSGEKGRNYQSSRNQKRGRDGREQKQNENKYEQNRKYELYPAPSYQKTYSSSYSDRLRQPVGQLTKKLSYDAYSAYRAPTGRYDNHYYDYQKQNPSLSGYNYYKNVPGYPFPKPNHLEKKDSYNQGTDSKINTHSQYNRYGSSNSKNYY